ncbi:MAG: DUF5652 family protein [Candidatus Pacebacteria bacterium]|nr:DUF5652 family protein [Candidatus Paceibacterota bacterium]
MYNIIYTVITTPYILFPLIAWCIAWKGWALWKAAKADQKWWFIAILVFNTLGILEILYIFVFSKMKKIPFQQTN